MTDVLSCQDRDYAQLEKELLLAIKRFKSLGSKGELLKQIAEYLMFQIELGKRGECNASLQIQQELTEAEHARLSDEQLQEQLEHWQNKNRMLQAYLASQIKKN